MPDFNTVYVTGTMYWCKVLGKPVNNYEGDAREWTFDFVPDDTSFLKEHGLTDRLKTDKKGNIEGDFLHLKKPELDKDGNENDPIRVYDSDNNEWDREVSIGNGSKVDLKLTIVDWGRGKRKSIWTSAIRVKDLVKYVSNEFGAMDGETTEPKPETDKPKRSNSKKTKSEMEELDDDIPF